MDWEASPLGGSEEQLTSIPLAFICGALRLSSGWNHKRERPEQLALTCFSSEFPGRERKCSHKPTLGIWPIGPIWDSQGKPKLLPLYIEITAPFQRPGATKEAKGNLISIQRTRVVMLSCQNVPRRTISYEGVETRAYRRKGSRNGVLRLEMRMFGGEPWELKNSPPNRSPVVLCSCQAPSWHQS